MRVVFAAAEVAPFSRTGGLGEVCGALPAALARLGHDLLIVTPFHRMAQSWFSRHVHSLEEMTTLELHWAGWHTPIRLLRSVLPATDVPVVFVAADAFDRDSIYAGFGGFDDDLERYTIFCRGVIEACEWLGQPVDLLHTHDWHTALLNVYLESGLRQHPVFSRTGSVFTIHNLHYQGRYAGDRGAFLGLAEPLRARLEDHGGLNMIKGGIVHARRLTVVSPTYAHEIQTPEGGAGLDGLMREMYGKLTGILNGIDPDEWNPETDPSLPARFAAGTMRGKNSCKLALRRECGFRSRHSRPLFGIVSRLVDQKGFDLLLSELPAVLDLGAELVVLGGGDPYYEESFQRAAERFPDRVRVWLGFEPGLARRIIAGSDVMLVPSRYEPCGLIQMQAMRYGSLPLVRRVGGLVDSVTGWNGTNRNVANGFAFDEPKPIELFHACTTVLSTWQDRPLWRRLRANAMAAGFSWERSAKAYAELYQLTVEQSGGTA